MMVQAFFGGKRIAIPVVSLCAAALISTGLIRLATGDDASEPHPLTASDAQQLAAATGNADTVVLLRIARQLGTQKLISVIYKGTRSQRLAALDAAAYVDTPTAMLPTLAALLSASDRQTAARAAGTMMTILFDPAARAAQMAEIIPGQATQIITQLIPVAKDPRLDADIRIAAMVGINRLSRFAPAADAGWSLALLADEEPLMREMSAAQQSVPLSKEALLKLAKLSIEDSNGSVRGVSAAMLCENALFHGVKEPSQDLADILTVVVKDPTISADALASVLICLARFAPAGRRQSIFEAAGSNPNEAVIKLLKTMNQN